MEAFIPGADLRVPQPTTCLAKLDRLGWDAGVSYRCLDVRIGIRVNQPEVPEALLAYLPPHSRPTGEPEVDLLLSLKVGGEIRPGLRSYNLGYVDIMRVARSHDLNETIRGLGSVIDYWVAVVSKEWLFVHAGVVGWNGKALLVPGRSRSGKTSLVAELVKQGATYYSDDWAVLDPEGRVHPFPKLLSIRQGSGEAERISLKPVETFGGAAGVEPLPVGGVYVTQFKEGARWRPRALSPGQAVLALLDNTVQARSRPQDALSILSRAVKNATAVRGSRGEAAELAARLLV